MVPQQGSFDSIQPYHNSQQLSKLRAVLIVQSYQNLKLCFKEPSVQVIPKALKQLISRTHSHSLPGSTDIKVDSITIPGCCASPCVIKKGSNISVTLNFTTDKNYTTMTQKACGEFGPTCVTLPTLDTKLCDFLTCPVTTGKMNTAKVQLPVQKTYPSVSRISQN